MARVYKWKEVPHLQPFNAGENLWHWGRRQGKCCWKGSAKDCFQGTPICREAHRGKLAFNNNIHLARLWTGGLGTLDVLFKSYMGWVGSILSNSAESLSLVGIVCQTLSEEWDSASLLCYGLEGSSQSEEIATMVYAHPWQNLGLVLGVVYTQAARLPVGDTKLKLTAFKHNQKITWVFGGI